MSHFTVCVIGNNVDEQLLPFIEQVNDDPKYAKFRKFKNCTGEVKRKWEKQTKDEWYAEAGVRIEDGDEEEDIVKALLKDGTFTIKDRKVPSIDWHSFNGKDELRVRFSVFFKRDGKKRRKWVKSEVYAKATNVKAELGERGTGTYIVSATFTKIDPPKEIPVKQEYPDIDTFAKEWFGYDKINGKWGYYHNPNAKWDWYQVGGRWSGYFLAKKDPKYPNDIAVGQQSFMGSPAQEGWCDQIRKCDIDLEGMKEWTRTAAKEDWKKYQDDIAKMGANAKFIWGIPESVTNEEEYCAYRMKTYVSSFALLKDGKWYEKGKMGWWAIVSDEKANWEEEFTKMFEALPDDALITVVDCHC